MANGTINSAEYVNQPPDVIGDNSLNTLNKANYVFTEADFTTGTTPVYHDPEGDAPLNLKINTLPVDGIIELNGTPVTPAQIVIFTDITPGSLLVFIPPNQDPVNVTTFDFSVSDVGSGDFPAPSIAGVMTMNSAAKVGNTLVWIESVINTIRTFMELTNASTSYNQNVTIKWTLTAINAKVGASVYVPIPGPTQNLYNVGENVSYTTVISQTNKPLFSMDFEAADPGDTATFEMEVTAIDIDTAPAVYPITFTQPAPITPLDFKVSNTPGVGCPHATPWDTKWFDSAVPNTVPQNGDIIYNNSNLLVPFNGGGLEWTMETPSDDFRQTAVISSPGVVSVIVIC